ncbi:hypothetical protein K9N68_10175 [Kovacikia minuta CCNUW1]|uniref:hypothetical protein n=1 Tax=Kovacikia minuta TaxID=2931930 RepID=UPI001CCEFB2A|nr:hypothetical protein [Kovacikia minuta]UBF28209.1 hypothetical protein K9N68_10175 [Kovacikia minuta CCNUW1]
MERAFKAPKRGDYEQWRKVQKLLRWGFDSIATAGITHHCQSVYEKSIRLLSNILITNSELQQQLDRCYPAKGESALAGINR